MPSIRRWPSLPALMLLLVALTWSCAAGPAAAKGGGKLRGHLAEQRSLGKAEQRAGAGAGSAILWGALIGDHITGDQAPWDMGAVRTLEAMLGKRMSLIHFMAPFSNCSSADCSYYRFPDAEMQTIRSHGAIPFFSWSSQAIPSTEVQPDYQLADVISGRYDSFIRAWARDAKRWGHPFFLRFNWEMNGDWFPWSEGTNGNRRGEYVRAWRHVHDLFDDVGATNATWTWCPNVDFEGKLQDLGSLYPGDDYVEWTCLDGYNTGVVPGKGYEWRSFDQLYERSYQEIVERIAPSKPMVIGEIASGEQGGSKAEWITEMLLALPRRYPMIRGFVWFDKIEEEETEWPIETSQSAVEAFAGGIGGRSYLGGTPWLSPRATD